MATKYIILLIIGALFMVYNVFFNKERDHGYFRGIGQLVNVVLSMVIALALAVITLIIF